MNIYFDLEFTGLHQKTTLVSLGMVSDDNRSLYAEATDYDRSQVEPWLAENVLPRLFLVKSDVPDLPLMTTPYSGGSPGSWTISGDRRQIGLFVSEWLEKFDSVEFWGDCLAWDWVLFCELFRGEDTAERLPRNVFYIPFDIATLMKVKGIDPDISREEFSGIALAKHNALDDARIIRACYERLAGL